MRSFHEMRLIMHVKKVFDDIIIHIENVSPFNITPDILQKKSGYSKRQLDRFFMKYTGVSSSTYIKIQRFFRIALALKYSTATIEQLCKRHGMKDVNNFVKKFTSTTGQNPDAFRKNNVFFVPFIFKGEAGLFKKHYSTCSFVSLFDFDIKIGGVYHKRIRSMDTMLSSHYIQKEEIIDQFCNKYHVGRDDIWTCSNFSPFSSDEYLLECYPCVSLDEIHEVDFDVISLQGDYLLFSWVGKNNDTYLRVKNIYDHFFFKFGVSRRTGFDIEKRRKIDGIRGHYVFLYYIPVVINEAILNAIDN